MAKEIKFKPVPATPLDEIVRAKLLASNKIQKILAELVKETGCPVTKAELIVVCVDSMGGGRSYEPGPFLITLEIL